MNVLKLLSVLMDYPEDELWAHRAELLAAADDPGLSTAHRARLVAFARELLDSDPLAAQEAWLALFDRGRSMSLLLFEHIHGESRDRGQAMVDLLKLYEESGYTPTAQELPDYLPLFLEYASTREPKAALELVRQPANVLAALRERLAKRDSPYEAVMAALLALSRAKLDAATLETLRAEPDPEPDDLEALDAAWADQEVTFGPGAANGSAGCPVDRMADRLRTAMQPSGGVAP